VRNEIVGSADASAVFQRFPLKKKPLTFVPGAGATGTVSSLELLVNGVLWSEVPTLYGHRENETVYVTRLSDDATTTVQFGDGRTGARPPSGVDNVVARYRQGSGLAGRLRAGALSNLLDRPIGVKAVTNPAATDGGADAETSANARRNAPTTVRTFGRAISLRDFVDIAMASGEVAKASATLVWSGDTRVIYLTVAAQLGGRFSLDGLTRIYAIITSQRDPNHSLEIGNFVPVPIVIAATLHVEPTRVTSAVLKAARESLTAALGFEAMGFGQPVHLSDMYRILQGVAGVEYVDIDMLHFKDRSASNLKDRGADSDPVQEHLRIFPARIVSGRVIAAEQAWIEVPTQDLTLLASGGLPD
jgi:predicted phage baseplate assembly protein